MNKNDFCGYYSCPVPSDHMGYQTMIAGMWDASDSNLFAEAGGNRICIYFH